MKKFHLLFLLITLFALNVNAQTDSVKAKRHISKTSVIRDSTGMVYPYAAWRKLVLSGEYRLKAVDPNNENSEYLIIKRDSAQMERRLSRMPKPTESSFFTIGEKLKLFNADDITDNKIKLKDARGKIIVLNFWFINCRYCRKEMPELNKLVLQYTNDPDVIFVAVALDGENDLRNFLKVNQFGYHVIYSGQEFADMYNVRAYPTNVVLDKEGKVRYAGTGYAANTAYWIGKTIEEVKHNSLP